jgi:hypothetical protein
LNQRSKNMNTLLGIVDWLNGGRILAKLLPLAEASDDGRIWAERFNDDTLSGRFPYRGSVVWFNPFSDAAIETIWQFQVMASPSYNPAMRRYERYRIEDRTIQEAREVLDLPTFEEDEEQLRGQLVEHGIQRPAHAIPRCYLRWGKWWTVEPVEMQYQKAKNRWHIPTAWCQQHPLEWVDWGTDLNSPCVFFHAGRYFLAPTARPQGNRRYMDWCTEYTLLADRVVADWRNLDPQFDTLHAPARQALRDFASYLATHADGNGDLALMRARLHRAEHLLDDAAGRQEVRLQLGNEIFEPILEEVREEERQAVRKEAEAEVAEVIRQRDEAQGQLARLRQEIEGLCMKRQAILSNLDESVTRHLEEVRDRPEEYLASVALLRPMLNVLGGGATSPASSAPVPSLPPLAEPLAGAADLAEMLTATLQLGDAPGGLARPLHSSFLAGAVPVLGGSRGLEALETYAACVASGRLLRITIVPTMLDPAELLARLRPLANATGGELCLAILDGVNRAAVDAYLLPVLTAGRGDGPGQLPANLLLAGLLSSGDASLGLPRAMWRYATLLLTDLLGVDVGQVHVASLHPDVRRAMADKMPRRRVEPGTWNGWREACQKVSLAPITELWSKAAGLTGDRGARDLCLRFFAAARQWPSTTDADACGDAAAFCLVPLLAGDSRAVQGLEGASPYSDLRAASDQAARLAS